MKYLMRVRDEAGAGAWRGTAVEGAVNKIVYENCPDDEAIGAALAAFNETSQGDLSAEVEKERVVIPELVRSAAAAFRPLGKPIATQFKTALWLDGIDVPLIGYVDYLYADVLIDLKTTLRMPSEPRFDHVVQVVSYAEATGRAPALIYVTPKKVQRFDKDAMDTERALWALRRTAHSIRSLLSMTRDAQDAAAVFSPNFESFYWNDATKAAAMELWQ